jgi:hypothetical protein
MEHERRRRTRKGEEVSSRVFFARICSFRAVRAPPCVGHAWKERDGDGLPRDASRPGSRAGQSHAGHSGASRALVIEPVLHSAPALKRLAVRIAVIALFDRFWPSRDAASATAALCAALAVGCGVAARANDEPLATLQLNRWGEAAILFALAALIEVAHLACNSQSSSSDAIGAPQP